MTQETQDWIWLMIYWAKKKKITRHDMRTWTCAIQHGSHITGNWLTKPIADLTWAQAMPQTDGEILTKGQQRKNELRHSTWFPHNGKLMTYSITDLTHGLRAMQRTVESCLSFVVEVWSKWGWTSNKQTQKKKWLRYGIVRRWKLNIESWSCMGS
jgi:hypothetical protein